MFPTQRREEEEEKNYEKNSPGNALDPTGAMPADNQRFPFDVSLAIRCTRAQSRRPATVQSPKDNTVYLERHNIY